MICLTPFDDIEEAVRLANDSEYSLIAGLWTSNLHEAMKYAPQLRAGSVQVNGSTIHIEPTFGNVSKRYLRSYRILLIRLQAGLGGASGYGRFNVDAVSMVKTWHAPVVT